jgi:hypothetical protein
MKLQTDRRQPIREGIPHLPGLLQCHRPDNDNSKDQKGKKPSGDG